MAHDVKSLRAMSQAELDALFSSVPAGPIPDGEAEGTGLVRANWLEPGRGGP
jgi:hypothetical protein